MATLPAPVRRQEYWAFGLAMIAGYVDGFGLLTFKTFLSFMSGNTTQVGSTIGRGAFAPAVYPAIAIVFFVIGVFAGNVLQHTGARQSRRLALAGVGTLLLLIVAGTNLGSLPHSVAIAAISFAMGIMNTTLSHVGSESVNLTFVTGTLNRIGRHLALGAMRIPLDDSQGPWDTQLRRAFVLSCLWTDFLSGAALAGIVTPRLAGWTLLPPATILLISASFGRTRSRAAVVPVPHWIDGRSVNYK